MDYPIQNDTNTQLVWESLFYILYFSKWVFRSCLGAWYDLGNGELKGSQVEVFTF